MWWRRERTPRAGSWKTSGSRSAWAATCFSKGPSGKRTSGGTRSVARLTIPVAGKHADTDVRGEIGILAGRRLRVLEKEVAKYRKAALDPAHPEALHRMRLAFKKYRYTAEIFLPLFPKAREETAKRLHDFQTLLGTIHDCDVILAEAASFRRDLLGRETECTLEIAFRAFRKMRFGEFRRAAGTAGSLLRIVRIHASPLPVQGRR